MNDNNYNVELRQYVQRMHVIPVCILPTYDFSSKSHETNERSKTRISIWMLYDPGLFIVGPVANFEGNSLHALMRTFPNSSNTVTLRYVFRKLSPCSFYKKIDNTLTVMKLKSSSDTIY